MTTFQQSDVMVAGRKVRTFMLGQGGDVPVLLLHGGVAGTEIFATGWHIWGRAPELIAAGRKVVGIDLTAFADGIEGPEAFTVEGVAAVAAAVIEQHGGRVDFVGHDMGASVGVYLGMHRPELLRALSIVCSPQITPSADSVANALLTHPPLPKLSRESQEWALDRLSYSPAFATPSFLDTCRAVAGGAYYARIASLGAGAVAGRVRRSLRETQHLLWEVCRQDGFKVPFQVIGASHDPYSGRPATYLLFKTMAEKQVAAQFHVINRAGALPFLEEPEVFVDLVTGFLSGLDEELAA